MKAMGFALATIVCLFLIPSVKDTAVIATPAAPTVSVDVTIDCPGVPAGTRASITATSGSCVDNCTGLGGTATFSSSGIAKITLSVTCSNLSFLTGCEFTAYWQEGSTVPKFKATIKRTKTRSGATVYTLDFKC